MAQKTFDQIRTDNEFTALNGTETLVISAAGVSAGGYASVFRDWILNSVSSTTISDASATGRSLITASDAATARGAINAQSVVTVANNSDATTGTSTTSMIWSPALIKTAVLSFAPTIPGAATTTTDGLMVAADKVKLDGVQAGAQVNPGNATVSDSGLMSSSDKTKLDGIEASANNYSLPAATTAVLGGVLMAPAVQDAVDETDVVAVVNSLLAVLRTSGVILP